MEATRRKLVFERPLEKMRQARQQIEEIRQEAVPAHASNNEIDPIPDSAYEETLDLLEKMPHNVPLPDIMWNEDGGIGLEWRPENGIVTMSYTVITTSSMVLFSETSVKLKEFARYQTPRYCKAFLQH